MPSDCPSSTGNAVLPNSSTMWWISLEVSAAVRRWLPVHVAIAGRASVWRPMYGCAADHGGAATPPWPAVAIAVICATSSGISLSPPASGSVSVGSESHESCCSSVYGCVLATLRQLSIAPVGQGGTHARHSSHTSKLTT